jgi:hypothetical protein
MLDDKLDKVLKISRVPLYYGWDTVTISVASAIVCTEGFLTSGPTSKAFESGSSAYHLLPRKAMKCAVFAAIYTLEYVI